MRGRSGDLHLGARIASAIAVAVACLAVLAPAATAQEDPYGNTTTTTAAPSAGASCQLSTTDGQAGDEVAASLTNTSGAGIVRILFGGLEVGRSTSAASTAVPFLVPDVAPGDYLVTAVGADFSVTCTTESGTLFSVLGAEITAGGGGGGALPRTGIYVALLLAIAIILIVLGRALIEASRRRRRRAQRAARLAARRPADAEVLTGRSPE